MFYVALFLDLILDIYLRKKHEDKHFKIITGYRIVMVLTLLIIALFTKDDIDEENGSEIFEAYFDLGIYFLHTSLRVTFDVLKLKMQSQLNRITTIANKYEYAQNIIRLVERYRQHKVYVSRQVYESLGPLMHIFIDNRISIIVDPYLKDDEMGMTRKNEIVSNIDDLLE